MYGGGHPVWRRPCETVVNIRYDGGYGGVHCYVDQICTFSKFHSKKKLKQKGTKSVNLLILKKVTDSDSTELHPHPVATPGSLILEFSCLCCMICASC